MTIRISLTVLLCFLLLQGGNAQKKAINNKTEISQEPLITWPADSAGYPEKPLEANLPEKFKNPPPGFGEVPFYWWVGDTLTKERLRWQLNKLHEAGVQGFSVSYPHGHPQSDPKLHQDGYGTFGMTYPSQPAIFSDEWWNLWNWFTGECAERGMGVGLDDYTLAVPGNHQWPDEIAALPKMRSYQGKLEYHNPVAMQGGETRTFHITGNTVSVVAFPLKKEGLEGKDRVNLLDEGGKNNNITWTAPEGNTWQVFPISTTSSFMLHPHHGKEVIKRYFKRFQEHVDPDNLKGLNYFFQDELTVDLGVDTWAEDFAEEFRRRKGYELGPYLAALHHDIGSKTVKIRIDYMDVLMDLAEERYFKPIYEWHRQRGLTYGCDNYGRGMKPTAYGDYFRATKWYTAPGNDAPQGGTALIQTKVSSSIAHLYHRPRVWLEAYHSMGWDARPEQITEATDIHYLLGGNLLCLHGLYYTTHGSRWEWAPPDFHFRMPYWPHMKKWLHYIERLSYLLTQGQHVCDVAVLYPTTPMQAYPWTTPQAAFSMARQLYEAGIDFDFIDHQSLAKAQVEDGRLQVAGESYRALILGGMKAMRFASLKKTHELYEKGGLVIAAGTLPQASERIGERDPEVDSMVREVFGYTAKESREKGVMNSINSPSEGTGAIVSPNDTGKVAEIIRASFTPDFMPTGGNGHKLHKRIGNHELYMVMDVPGGTTCFFRSHGKAELWNAWTGETEVLQIVRKTS